MGYLKDYHLCSCKQQSEAPHQIFGSDKGYKTACDNHAVVKKWWFILRGSEECLHQLENEWEPVATHTSWKIEPAYHFICDADEQHGSDQECDKVPADNAPEQHGSDQECKVPADKSKNVNSDNESHNVSTNVSTNPCEMTSVWQSS